MAGDDGVRNGGAPGQGAGGDGGFEAATGDGPVSDVTPGVRAAEVRVAFEGLLQIRRLTHTGS
ncbi:hypothetical protein GT042_03505, partial [Streptomyces sp. SID3212]|nr:hypothetical protein [Streptomyces sp. SID3212]